MTVAADGLGELLDLAKALGIADGDDQVNGDWFADPGHYVGRMLREPAQRDALLRALEALLAQEQPVATDADGRRWVPVLTEGGLTVSVVVTPTSGGCELALGAVMETTAPQSSTRVLVPLLSVPTSAPVVILPGQPGATIHLSSEIAVAAADPPPGEAGLRALSLAVDVATDGTLPNFSLLLRGLRLPGQSAPTDVRLGDAAAAGDLGDEALRLLTGLLQQVIASASGELAEALALLGLSGDPSVPALPVSELLARGHVVWAEWLDAVLASDAAIDALLGHLRELAGHGATVVAPPAAEDPHRVRWTLPGGAELAISVAVATAAAGSRSLELGLAVSQAGAAVGALQAQVELDARLVRFELGSAPKVVALPLLELTGRLGDPTNADPLLDEPGPPEPVRVGSLRAGLTLDGDRRPALVLAAHDVTIAAHVYPVLDLTNVHTLADVAGNAVGDVADDVLGLLGPAQDALRVLFGLASPPGAGPWPVPLTGLPDLLADPLRAVLGYHERVIRTHSDGYRDVLGALRELLATGGMTDPVTGAGTEADPWTLPVADGVAIVAWADGAPPRLHLGSRLQRELVDLGGSCPTLRLDLVAELARLELPAGGGALLPSVHAELRFGARGGEDLRVGEPDAALLVDSIGVRLGWDRSFVAHLDLPNLRAEIDGEVVPVALPQVREDGTFTAEVPWRALEVLTGHVLRRVDSDWSRELLDLLGWLAQPRGPSTPAEGLSLERLFEAPVDALRDWLEERVVGRELRRVARWLALLISGPAAPGVPAGVVWGRGEPGAPFVVPLSRGGPDALLSANLALWAGEPPVPELDELAFRPGELVAWLEQGEDAVPQPDGERLAALLARVAPHSQPLADALDGRADLGAGLDALVARLTDSDGLVATAAATVPGATVHDLADAPNGRLPALLDLPAVLGIAPPPSTVFVTGPFGATSWPGVAADHVLDLSTPALAPEAFDVARLAAQDGPWLVVLPPRADAAVMPTDDPAERQAARLARAVDAVVARAAGAASVVLVAHGAAGHAALRVAAARPGVTHLVTLGTPHGGAGLEILEAQPGAGALQLLASLLPAPSDERPEHPLVTLGRGLAESLLAVYDSSRPPTAELAPPTTTPTVPGTVAVHCVRGRVAAAGASRAVTGLVLRVLQDAYEAASTQAEQTPGPGAGDIATGLLVRVAPTSGPGSVRVRAELTVSVAATGLARSRQRGLRARIEVDRVGGWLAGGPDPARAADVLRHPSLRRATIEVELPLAVSQPASARLILHEAVALGARRARWVISHTDLAEGSPLLPEARLLVGRLAAVLGPLPGNGPARQLADLLHALGVTEPGIGVDTGATLALSIDGIQRLLVDPRALLAGADPAELVGALAAMLGGTADGTRFGAVVDGVALSADVGARTLRLDAAGLDLAAGMHVAGGVTVALDGVRDAHLEVALGRAGGPSGRPVIALAGSPPRLALRFEGAGRGLPAEVELHPHPDGPGLARVLVVAAPAQALWAGITFLRGLDPGVVTLVDPLLRASGLLVGGGEDARVVVPVGLLSDPAAWFGHPALLAAPDGGVDAAKLNGLLDAAGTVLGIKGAEPGTWELPYGIRLRTGSIGGHPSLAVAIDEPLADTALRIAGAVALAPGPPVGLEADLTVALAGATSIASAGRIELSAGSAGLTVRLRVPGHGIDLTLIPPGAGLASLAGAAAQAAIRALPYALDTVVELPPAHPAHPVGVAVAALGDALALRSGAGTFDGDQLEQLAAAPGPQLAQRLSADLAAGLDALRELVAPALPTGVTLSRVGGELVLAKPGPPAIAIHLTLPSSGGVAQSVRVLASVGALRPIDGATLGAELELGPSGISAAQARFAVDPASGLALGPVTVAPRAEMAFGATEAEPRVAVGFGLDATRAVLGVLRFGPPIAFALEAEGTTLPEAIADLLVPIAVDTALDTDEVEQLLAKVVLGGATVKQILDGVVFDGASFDPAVLDPEQLFTRLLKLAANIAARAPSLRIDPLTLSVAARSLGAGDDVYGVAASLPPGGRLRLVDGEITVDVEVDASWVHGGATSSGIVIELLRVTGGTPAPFFGLELRGVGLRFGRTSRPLLDTFVATDSVALHGLLEIDAAGVQAAGGQLELTGLRVPVASGQGGNNRVAAGLMRDTATGQEKPEPKFSPALALQRGGSGVSVDLRAGEGDGPWFVTVQRGFGPVYIEQVGFGVSKSGDKVIAARVLIDGEVSIFGLTMAVDDLALGARWPQSPGDPELYNPQAWEVGLAGLAVAADTSGISISGGLKRAPGNQPDYVGMILLRFGVYGLTAFGGYSVTDDASGEFTSFFIFGALVAPLGGPPAFFVTGIGAGVGVSRRLLVPSDFSQFPGYPFLQALDPHAQAEDPMVALDRLRQYFPAQRGAFWFAAGLSFTSFALVECVAVLSVAVDDGLEVNLMGLARAALPAPAAPLVQLELALLVRFSSREGVIWVQGQLTDNSFLLTRDCRLTGGFAYVAWFKGSKAGEFVLTMGGYHPSFHRDGYPVVPRLGFVWGVADILVIKGESYFALTSEAIMAGTRFEARLDAGPLWAYLRLGADGIVYFDPFHFEVTAFAELGAGVTIDIDLGWFGHIRVTISVHLHADVLIAGPQFHGRATIDLDVTSASISFGDDDDRSTAVFDWPRFDDKYMRPGGARVLTVVPGRGLAPPSPADSSTPATGDAGDPFLLLPEFELSVTTTAATSAVVAGGAVPIPGGEPLAIGPMHVASAGSTLTVTITNPGAADFAGVMDPVATTGAFPKGIWGPQPDDKPVPTGETITAANGVHLTSAANISVGTTPIDYHQVEIRPRHPLPFLAESAVRGERLVDVNAAAALVAGTTGEVGAVLALARDWMTVGKLAQPLTPLAAATFRSGRSAPPQLAPLTLGMAVAPAGEPEVPAADAPPTPPVVDTSIHPPRVQAFLSATPSRAVRARPLTTLGQTGAELPRMAPATPADVLADQDVVLATRSPRRARAAVVAGDTLVAGTAPFSGRAGGGLEARRRTGADPEVLDRLGELTKALAGDGLDLLAGEALVLGLPNAARDIEDARAGIEAKGGVPVRVVGSDSVGSVVLDQPGGDGIVLVPHRTARVAVLAGAAADGAPGWQATTRLVQLGRRAFAGPGATIEIRDAPVRRDGREVSTSFVAAADVVGGFSIVTTRFAADVSTIAVALEALDGRDDVAARALDLGLAGASRVRGADARVVVAGGRAVAVYDIVPDGNGEPVAVTVASGEGVQLAGVLAGRSTSDELSTQLQARGFDGLLSNLVAGAGAPARVRWIGQEGNQ